MKTKPFLLIAAIAIIAGSSGCDTVNTVQRAQPIGQRQMIADKRIITDASLNRIARIVGINETTGPGGFVKVQVELLNVSSDPQSFSYKFEWLDLNGMQVNTPTSTFIPRQIEARESIFISSIAPSANAKDFRLKLIASHP